jgi:hypothetical protein
MITSYDGLLLVSTHARARRATTSALNVTVTAPEESVKVGSAMPYARQGLECTGDERVARDRAPADAISEVFELPPRVKRYPIVTFAARVSSFRRNPATLYLKRVRPSIISSWSTAQCRQHAEA